MAAKKATFQVKAGIIYPMPTKSAAYTEAVKLDHILTNYSDAYTPFLPALIMRVIHIRHVLRRLGDGITGDRLWQRLDSI